MKKDKSSAEEYFENLREIVKRLAVVLGHKNFEYPLNADDYKAGYKIRRLTQDLETLSVQASAFRHDSESKVREEISYATTLEVEIGAVQLEKEDLLDKYSTHIRALRKEITEAERHRSYKAGRKRKNQ